MIRIFVWIIDLKSQIKLSWILMAIGVAVIALVLFGAIIGKEE